MKTVSYWSDNTPRPADMPLAELPERVDVTVVGSGFTGLNAALSLAKNGADVAVLEQETIGWGASSRNGGMAATGMMVSPIDMKKRFGLEKARKYWEWSLQAMAHIVQVIDGEQMDCDLVRQGNMFLASKAAHFTHMRTLYDILQHDFGYREMHLLSRDELASEIGSGIYHGGLLDTYTGGLDPAKFTYGLGYAAARHGAKLVENTCVTALHKHAGGFRLDTSKGQLQTSEVLLATNGYTTALVPPIRRGVFPAGSYIIVTEPLPQDLQQELSPNNRMFEDSKRFLSYFRLTADGRALLGGRSSLLNDLDLQRSANILQKGLLEIWPQLTGYEITHSWTGYLGMSFDLMPHAGRSNGVWYANGFCGHGLPVGSLLGYEMGEVIAGKRPNSLMMEIKQPRYFFACMDKLFLPLATAWYRMLDWLQ